MIARRMPGTVPGAAVPAWKERRRRRDRIHRALSELFFASFMVGILAAMAFLVRMVLPVL